ncbi:MAG: hypothetical protein ABSB50_13060 [Terracidiphilus sp.]|jgi:hypothetical protein
MKMQMLRGVVAALLLSGAVVTPFRARAQEDRGPWTPASSNASAITGYIVIADGKVTIDYWIFPLAQIRRLKPVEVSSVFDADVSAGISGTLYRLRVPAAQRFEHKNTLCGGEDAQWMATYVAGKKMEVAFFSGDDMPVFTFDAMQKSSTLCGTFGYSR